MLRGAVDDVKAKCGVIYAFRPRMPLMFDSQSATATGPNVSSCPPTGPSEDQSKFVVLMVKAVLTLSLSVVAPTVLAFLSSGSLARQRLTTCSRTTDTVTKPQCWPPGFARSWLRSGISASPPSIAAASRSKVGLGATEARIAASQSQPVVDGGGKVFSGPHGAEWAGWECQFSASDGKRIAVPEDYVPASLGEWDVEVWGFETLVSEQLQTSVGEDQGSEGRVLYRKRARVYPEVGCALDNLSLEVQTEKLPLQGEAPACATFSDGSYVLIKRRDGSSPLEVEAGLVVSGRAYGDVGKYKDIEDEQSRARVIYRIEGEEADGPNAALKGTLTFTRERKYRTAFDDGLLYKGGGLDAQKLRGLLQSNCFAETEEAPTAASLAGEWRIDPGAWHDFHNQGEGQTSDQDARDEAGQECSLSRRAPSFWDGVSGLTSLLVRGGLTVRAGPWDTDGKEDTWSMAAACCSNATEAPAGEGRMLWGVEVGWLVCETRRDVLTTVFDAASLVPVGAWRGTEERVPSE